MPSDGHFGIGFWADYVRELTPAGRREEMERHLSGCTECQATVAFLDRLARTAAGTSSVAVPDDLVRAAKSIFPAAELAVPPVPRLRRLIARLTVAPFLDPSPAGVRSDARPLRQALYQAGDYSVDLRVDSDRGSADVTLVGQIANQASPSETFAQVPVYLLAGRRIVCQTVSNDFGEFCLECKPGTSMRLCVPLPKSGVQVEVSLNRLMSDVKFG